jgi:hypothetical protein
MVRRTYAKVGMNILHCNMDVKKDSELFFVSRCLYQHYYWCCKWGTWLYCARDMYGNHKKEILS